MVLVFDLGSYGLILTVDTVKGQVHGGVIFEDFLGGFSERNMVSKQSIWEPRTRG